MQNRPIGILDSGLGGLTIWNEVAAQLPAESIIYIADSRNCPYGNKDRTQIYKMSKRMVTFLISKKVKLIVVACNTITVSCLDKLRLDFPNVPIVGIVPVIKTAAEKTRSKRIGVLSTTRTAASVYQKNLIKQFAKNCKVFVHGTDELVPLIENGEITGKKITDVLQKTLEKFRKEEIDTLALGCSHFPFLEKEIRKILGNNTLLLDSSGAAARQVKRVLKHNDSLVKSISKPEYKFFTTGNTQAFERITKFFKRNKLMQSIDRIEL